jgi:hypothetical protein
MKINNINKKTEFVLDESTVPRFRSTALAALSSRWRRWTAIVEIFASRRRGRSRVNPEAYRALHRDLTRLCQSLAASADEPERVFCRTLESLVQPWLNPGVLARADREILDDLLNRCREAERELGERTQDPAARRRGALVIVVSAVMAGLFVLAQGVDQKWLLAPGRVQGWSDLFGSTLGTFNDKASLFILIIIVIPASLALLSCIRRR